MKTVEFKEVLINVAELLGVNPDHTDVTTIVRRAAYTTYIHRRVREGWEQAFWPEWTLLERRQYKLDWLVGTTYALDDERYNSTDDAYYTSLQAANTGHQPDTSPTWWEISTNWERFIAYDQAGETEIGEVKAVYRKNPRINQKYPGEVGFEPKDNGILVSTLAPARPYIEFRLIPPTFTQETWLVGTTYALSKMVYNPTDDQYYNSLKAANTGNQPDTSPTWWEISTIPKLLQPFVELAAYADGLRGDGQAKKSKAELTDAYGELARIEDIVFGQQRQSERVEVRGY